MTAEHENVKHSKKKANVDTELVKSHIVQWGLKKPTDTYLGITYHFIDWEIRAVTVDSEKMTDSTTGDDLKFKVPKSWEKRDVAGLVVNVTDCEPSMVKMDRLVMEETL